MKTALVTGATGFIGRALCARLQERGVGVRALARRETAGPWNEFVVTDLGDGTLDAAVLDGIDTVFHLAGKAHAVTEVAAEEAGYRRLNVEGTRVLLSAATRRGISRLVFFSSVKAMGEGGKACVDEGWDAPPETVYGKTKLQAERLVLEAGRQCGMHVCNLRAALVYGPGVKGNLARMIEAIDRGRFPPLPETGNRRSMVHVDDVVRAAVLVAEKSTANGQTYIVTANQAYSTREIYVSMAEALGKAVPRWTIPKGALWAMGRVGDVMGRLRGRRFMFDSDAYQKLLGSAWYSSEKIVRDLGYRPTRTLEDAIGEMVDEYRRTKDSGLRTKGF